jgi:hypothetical protein
MSATYYKTASVKEQLMFLPVCYADLTIIVYTKLCYDHCSTTAQELCQCIQKTKDEESPLVDEFGMTPFHILFSSVDPSDVLLEVFLDKYPYHILGCKDTSDKLAMDYLVSNWTPENKVLLQMALQSWMFGRLERWCLKGWRSRMIPLVNALLAEDDDKERRMALFVEACSVLKQYEDMEATSILEMALWKGQPKGGCNNDGTKRQALDREQCRCFCG